MMKVMLISFVAIAVIGVAAQYVLGNIGYSSQDRMSGQDVRLD